MQKRIEISDTTLALLQRLNEELAKQPRSIGALEEAISTAARRAVESLQYSVKLNQESEKRIAGLIEYGFAQNREELISAAVDKKIEGLMPQLKERIEEEIKAKQAAFGLE